MSATAAEIIEMDVERDRKTCIHLDLKVTGANRELAQWLTDHPQYSNALTAGWLSCGKTRIFHLRKWASNGFAGTPFDSTNKPDDRLGSHRSVSPRDQEPLDSLDNFESGEEIAGVASAESEIADPSVIEDNLIYSIQRMNEHARVFKKLFKASSFDPQAKERIDVAIERMIQKWRSVQSTLTRSGSNED